MPLNTAVRLILHVAALLASFLLCLPVTASASGFDNQQDSTTIAMRDSYNAKLDSATVSYDSGDYKTAVRLYAAAFRELRLHDLRRRQYMADYLEELYKTGQKEERVAFLNETITLQIRQNILLGVLAAGIILILVVLFFLLSYRLRSVLIRARHKENEAAIANLQKEAKKLEARLQAAESEKYQKRLLAESLLVSRKNSILEELRTFFDRTPGLGKFKNDLETILSDERLMSGGEASFNADIREIHPMFYGKLQQKSGNRLSALNLEYCRMIFIGMSTKEIGNLLKVDPKTVRVNKYRLKKKLGLGSEDDLAGFIRGII